MFKRTLEYKDFNGEDIKKDFYFDLNKAEVLEMEMGTAGGMQEYLQRIVDSKEGGEIMKTFKKIILKAYGEKSPDGQYFMKSEEISNRFEHSAAYPEIFYELCTDATAASDFINNVIPDLKDEANAVSSTHPALQ